MPDFTFIKHGWGQDPELRMTFNSDSLEKVRDCFEDFVRGSGFVVQEEIVEEDQNPKDSDYWWCDPISQSGSISSVFDDDYLFISNNQSEN